MRKYIKFKLLAGMVVFIICLVSLRGSYMKVDERLDQRLAAIRSQNKGEETDWAKLEAECLKLVKDHNSLPEKGKIYAKIALIYGEKGYTSREDVRIPKAIKYCKEALHYPLEVTTACEMYARWAGSLIVTYWSYPEEEFVKRRREAIVLCLTGLKLALDNRAPKEYPKAPPPVGKYDIHPEKGPIYEEAVRKHREQLAAHKKWEFQEKLYFQRKALTQICVSLYSHMPYDTDELKYLAQVILIKYDEAVKELVGEVQTEIAQKEKGK